MASPFSSEKLVFLQRFVTSIVRSMVGEDSRPVHEAESRVEGNAASRSRARPKRKFRAPSEASIDSSPSPRIKKPKANHDVVSTEPLKPRIPLVFRYPAPKANYSGLRTDAYRVCLRCSQLGHDDDDCVAFIPSPIRHPITHNPYLAPCRGIVPFNPRFVYAAPPVQRLGCNLCGYHHSPKYPCSYCPRCNCLGHSINSCRFN